MAVQSYPFLPRNPAYPTDEEIIFTAACTPGTPQYKAAFERSQGEEARLHRLRYLSIEEELERAYRYVSPSEENADAFSLKFAEIIRAAANGYEIFCKTLYARFYNDMDKLNIYNYLALDRFLSLAGKRVTHLMAVGNFPTRPEVSQPFAKLVPWDGKSSVQSVHTPNWWTAYNEVKHMDAGLKTHATLANATAAVAALFLLTETAFGFGVLNGGVIALPGTIVSAKNITLLPRWARLFGMP